METTCPVGETYCPAIPTLCPEVATECPEVATTCPAVATTCPEVATTCPEAATICPAGPDCEPSITVNVDVRPSSLNLKSKGVLPVVIFGSKDFDVKNIDPMTIMMSREGIAGGVSPIRYNNMYKIMILKFESEELVDTLMLEEVAGQTIWLTITGNLKDGTPFSGEDSIKILKKNDKKDKDEDKNKKEKNPRVKK
jgi:hypothetical protein